MALCHPTGTGVQNNIKYDCKGKVKRGICNLSLEDLPEMFRSGCLFANKFDLQSNDGRVVGCMHEYLTQ